MRTMLEQRKKSAADLRAIYDRNKIESKKFDEILRAGREVLEGQEIGNRMDLILTGNEVPALPQRRQR
jgi:hypothetical protein